MRYTTFMQNQKGMAMPTVIILFAVITLVSFSALTISLSQGKMNEEFIVSIDALHYAEAGINEYVWHLNKDNPDYIDLETDVEIKFGGEVIEGAMYRIDIIGGAVEEGRVRIKSTGFHVSKPDKMRTIEALISKRNFTEHVWLSNTEGNVYFASIHEIHGPVHTNNNLNIMGSPEFFDRVTYVNNIHTSGTVNPVYHHEGSPRKVTKLEFPNSNTELKSRAIDNGHYYNGMTAIFLNGDSYDVRSYSIDANKWEHNGFDYHRETGKWYYNWEEYSGNDKPVPGDICAISGRNSIPLPENGVIYVDGTTSTRWRRSTGDVYVSGTIDGQLTIASANNVYITGYDPTNFSEPEATGSDGKAKPRFLPEGETGGINYSGTDSLIGLIAENDIVILDQGWPKIVNGNSDQEWDVGDVAIPNINLSGAYMALNGTIRYNHGMGIDKGTAMLDGSFIQNTRGAFASGNNGYGRDFRHDSRLTFRTPPYFLNPVDSGWELNEWREISDHVVPTD